MEGAAEIDVLSDQMAELSGQLSEVVANQADMIQCLVDVNTKLQYQLNQNHVLLVGLTLVFVTYLLYRILKNFC